MTNFCLTQTSTFPSPVWWAVVHIPIKIFDLIYIMRTNFNCMWVDVCTCAFVCTTREFALTTDLTYYS